MKKILYILFYKLKRFLYIFSNLLLVCFTVVMVWLIIQMANTGEANILGYRLYVVVTDSMSPMLNVGDVILSKSFNPEELNAGDIVTFKGTSGSQKGLIITHMVEKAPYTDETGKTYIVTRGVKENSPLDSPVAIENVRAVMVQNVEILGKIYKIIKTPGGFIFLIFLPLFLFTIYQLYKIANMSAVKKYGKV